MRCDGERERFWGNLSAYAILGRRLLPSTLNFLKIHLSLNRFDEALGVGNTSKLLPMRISK